MKRSAMGWLASFRGLGVRMVFVLATGVMLKGASNDVNGRSLEDAQSKRESEAVIGEYAKYVEENPNSFQGLLVLGSAMQQHDRQYKEGGKYHDTIVNVYRRALEMETGVGVDDEFHEDRITAMRNLALIYKEMGKPNEGIAIATELIDLVHNELRALDVQDKTNARRVTFLTHILEGSYQDRADMYQQIGAKADSMADIVWLLNHDSREAAHATHAFSRWGEDDLKNHGPKEAKSWMEYLDQFVEDSRADDDANLVTGTSSMRKFALFNMFDNRVSKLEKENSSREAVDSAKELAWSYLRIGNQQMLKLNGLEDLNLDRERKNFNMIKTIFRGSFWTVAPGLSEVEKADARRVIFIVGLPRSGSTLVETILHSHSKVSGLGEDSIFNSRLQKVQDALVNFSSQGDLIGLQGYIRSTRSELLDEIVSSPFNVKGTSVVVDKMLFNFSNIGYIKLLLGRACVIHSYKKNPLDAFFSLYKKQFPIGTAPWSYDWQTMQGYYDMYLDLMSHWKKELPDFVMDYPYEDLVQDPEKQVRALLQFCGLEWEPQVLEFSNGSSPRAVLTHSVDQVNQPLYKTAIGSWKRYEDFITPQLVPKYKRRRDEL